MEYYIHGVDTWTLKRRQISKKAVTYNSFVVEINPFGMHDKINTINGLIKDTQHGHKYKNAITAVGIRKSN